MKSYTVELSYCKVAYVEVEAEDEYEAREKVEECGPDDMPSKGFEDMVTYEITGCYETPTTTEETQ